MKKVIGWATALIALSAVLTATPGVSNAAPAPGLSVAQAEAAQAQIPPKVSPLGSAAAGGVVKQASKPVTSPAGIMSPKGKPRSGSVKPLVGCAPSCYYYGIGKQDLAATTPAGLTGLQNRMGVFNPDLGTKGTHSLAEIGLQSSDQQQTVEVGWTKDNTGVCASTTTPCFFVYSWRNGVGMGYNGGNGWINYNGRPITPGDSMTADLNTEASFAMLYNPPVAPATTGRWWAGYANASGTLNNWVGSWPESSWTTGVGAIPSLNRMYFIQTFGETNQTVDAPCAMMGNGTLGSAASGGAAPAAGPARIGNTVYTNGPTIDLTIGSTTALQPVGNLSATHKTFTYGGPKKTTTPC